MSNSKPNINPQNQQPKSLQQTQKQIVKKPFSAPATPLQKKIIQNFSVASSYGTASAIKDVSSVDVVHRLKPNTAYLHMFYILLIVTSHFVMFSYFSSKQKPPTIIYEKITERSIETRPALPVPPVLQVDLPSRSTASITAEYPGHDFEKDAIVQKIKFEFSEKRNIAFNEYLKESNQYRDTHKRFYENKDYQEITNRHEKKNVQIRGEEFEELCKKTLDSYYCKSAENFNENKEKFY